MSQNLADACVPNYKTALGNNLVVAPTTNITLKQVLPVHQEWAGKTTSEKARNREEVNQTKLLQ